MTSSTLPSSTRSFITALAATLIGVAASVSAQTGINVTGGAAAASQTLPAGQAQFGIRVPLKPNAENILTITATSGENQTVSQNVSVTQLTLEEIVRARVTAQRLTTPEVKALVADGTIDLKDPDNFAVSVFDIVLTIGGRPAQVQMPVVRPKEQPFGVGEPISIGCSSAGKGIQTTERSISIPCGGGGGESKLPQIEVIPFEIEMPDAEVEARVPGVILIEGRIKTLKDFYRVTLLLMNVSGLFTLNDIVARLEVPEGALKHIAPASGTVAIDPIAAGGQGTGEFIVRGDRIGVHTVVAHFGAHLTAPFLPAPVPIAGSASTDVEVKAPPHMDVTVEHPNFVRAGEPYLLKVTIENTDPERDALYTTFELDVGVDAELIDETTSLPLEGPAVRTLGDILVGQKVTQTFHVRPKKTGPIASCTAGANENLKLNVVFTGPGGGPGCAIGTLPSHMKSPDGRPTVSVIPTHNTTGVTVDPAIAAIFSAPMITSTITTGSGATTFKLLDPHGTFVPGELQFGEVFGGTVAIFRPSDVLQNNAEYTVMVEPTIFDENGLQLASGMIARFTTEKAPAPPDLEPPHGILMVDSPVNPSAITKGQLVPVTVDSFDNVGVVRVDALLDGAIVDSKKPNSPVHFLVDTAGFAPGSEHVLSARLLDDAGNESILTATLRIAADTTPPTVTVNGPTAVARGRALSIIAEAADDGRVDNVEFFVDAGAIPGESLRVGPFAAAIPTSTLRPGSHLVRAVATDGAGNTAFADHLFVVVEDSNAPAVVLTSPASGAQVRAGTILPVLVTATDDIGVVSIESFLDNEGAARSTDISGFSLATAGLALGPHSIRVIARDAAGNNTTAVVPFVLFDAPADTTSPAAPNGTQIGIAVPVNGVAAITGLAGAAEAGSMLEIRNVATAAGAQATASTSGAFTANIDGAGGQSLVFVAIDAAGNRSAPTTKEIPRPAALMSLNVTPVHITLNRTTPSQPLSVIGVFSDGSQRSLSATEVTFSSLARTIADVSGAGLVLPGSNGATAIRVAGSGVPSVDVPVTVAMPTIANVAVAPNPVVLSDIGRTQRLSLTAIYSDGYKQAFPGSVVFATNTPSIATIDSSGLITAVGLGDGVVSVAANALPVINVPVTVRRKTLTSIAATPASITLIGAGQTQQIAVTGTYSDSSSETLTGGLIFQSSNPLVASVTSGGLVTSGNNGNTSIAVSASGVTPLSIPVRVKSLTSIVLTPASVTLIGLNKTQQLTVTGMFSDGSITDNPSGVTFESTNSAAATVDGNGLVTSVAIGTTTIRARLGALTAERLVTIDPLQPVAIVTSPASLAFSAVGETVQLTAHYRMNDGTMAPIGDPITFASRNVAVAHVAGQGLVTALETGLTFIDVAAGSVSVAVVTSVDVAAAGTPEITSLGRRIAAESDTVLIHGRNFHGFAERNAVTFNGVAATVIGASEDRLIAIVPRSATSGPVQVTVDGAASNTMAISIYARRARAQQVTSSFNATPEAPGTRMTLGTIDIDYRAGDHVVLSGFADTIAAAEFNGLVGPQFSGRLLMSVAGRDVQLFPSAGPIDLVTAADLEPGEHQLTFHLEESGGALAAGDLAVVAGPPATGPFAGERFLPADTIDQRVAVRFRNLRRSDGTLLPDGTKVAVTAANWNRLSDGGCCNGSAGGTIVDGVATADGRLRAFTITNGGVTVTYSDSGIFAAPDQARTAFLSVVPADGNGNRLQDRPIAVAPVLLGAVDSASVVPAQTSSVADGTDRPITVEVNSIRDVYGNRIPDSTRLALTASNWNRVSDGGCCNGSVGGIFTNGEATPDGRLRAYVVTGGKVNATYSSTGVSLTVGDIRSAILSVVAVDTGNDRKADRPFAAGHITMSSASGGEVRTHALPVTLAATTQDNRSVVTIFNITDASGRPVPNGTKIAVSASNWNRVSDGGCCNGSIGGTILGGSATDDGRVRSFSVQSGQVVLEYSAQGIGLGKDATANAIVSMLPANELGNRVGDRPFAAVTIPLGGVSSATVMPQFSSSIADGTDRPMRVVVENIHDAFGNPVPDGTRIGLTASNWNRVSDGGCCNGSVGGAFTDGSATTDGRVRAYVVTNGRVEATYSPVGVQLGVGSVRNAILSAVIVDGSGNRVADRPFAAGTVTLSSASGATADMVLEHDTLLADTQDHRSTVTITDLRDSQGRLVPDGTRFGVTAANWNRASDGGCCNGSVGGGFIGGSPTDDGRVKSFTLTNGTLQFTYTDAGVGLQTGQTAPAIISVLPADGSGNRIGDTPILATTIVLGGIGSATFSAPATVVPGGTATIVFSDIRDQLGNLVPDGTRVALTANNWNRVSDGGCCNGSGGGSFSDGASTEDGRLKMFTVTNGQVTATFVAPSTNNVTSVISAVPARADGVRLGDRPFAAGSIRVTTTP